MKLQEWLASLPPEFHDRFLGRIEGLQLAQRICHNHADHIAKVLAHPEIAPGAKPDLVQLRYQEALAMENIIRFVQVGYGNGRFPIDELTPEELDAIWRIE